MTIDLYYFVVILAVGAIVALLLWVQRAYAQGYRQGWVAGIDYEKQRAGEEGRRG